MLKYVSIWCEYSNVKRVDLRLFYQVTMIYKKSHLIKSEESMGIGDRESRYEKTGVYTK